MRGIFDESVLCESGDATSCGASEDESPFSKLALSLLKDGIARCAATSKRRQQRSLSEFLAWMMADSDEPYSFDAACEALGVETRMLREHMISLLNTDGSMSEAFRSMADRVSKLHITHRSSTDARDLKTEAA